MIVEIENPKENEIIRTSGNIFIRIPSGCFNISYDKKDHALVILQDTTFMSMEMTGKSIKLK